MPRAAQYPDDDPEALSSSISLNEAYVCQNGLCPSPLPLVVCEKHLLNAKAGRRFFCICPTCHWGFKVISSIVVNDVKPVIPDGACVFDLDPHGCGEQPPRRKPRPHRKPRKRG